MLKSRNVYELVQYRQIKNLSHPQIFVGGSSIEFVDEWPHLRHIITVSHTDNHDIINCCNSLCGQITNVLSYFSELGIVIKLKLLRSYCSSFYGCELWDLSKDCVDDFCITCCKDVKRVWGLPQDTHRRLIDCMSALWHISTSGYMAP